MRASSPSKEFRGHQSRASQRIYDALTKSQSKHGRCTDWIRENRRRRAAGIPQLRFKPASIVFKIRAVDRFSAQMKKAKADVDRLFDDIEQKRIDAAVEAELKRRENR